jgi:hypothetical protein
MKNKMIFEWINDLTETQINSLSMSFIVSDTQTVIVSGTDVVNTLTFEYSTFKVINANTATDFVKLFTFFKSKYIHEFSSIAKDLFVDFNVLENYDRYEDTTVNTSADNSSSSVNQETTNDTPTWNDTNKVCASGEGSSTGNTVSHIHGNIGVTKATDMINDDIRLRLEYNMIDVIMNKFKDMYIY